MEWIDKNRFISIIITIAIILACNALFWKLYAVYEVENYVDEVNEKTLNRIEIKLDTLIEDKNGSFRKENELID